MYRTLLFIPHEMASIPVFGFGWALAVLASAFVARLSFAVLRNRYISKTDSASDPENPHRPRLSIAEIISGEGRFWGLAAFLVTFILPSVELTNVAGQPVGMAIRGYGVFLVLGVASAVALAAYRCKRAGMDPELIFALAPWVFIGGIAGARAFYVIQYRQNFVGATAWETLKKMLAFTEGGLVVYGSFMGGFLAFIVFTYRNRIPVLKFGDAIVPCIFLGVFFGRLGCLMNGCCYGGRCEEGIASLRFPPLSAVYQDQLTSGELVGLRIDPSTGVVQDVVEDGVADRLGIEPGELYRGGEFDDSPFATADASVPSEMIQPGWRMKVGTRTYTISPEQLPSRSLPVRAAQPISSLSGLTLCVLLCAASAFIRRPGVLMGVGFASYAVVRFGLEIVRVDESGQLGTQLSISQWVSIAVFTLSIIAITWLLNRPEEAPTAEYQS